MRSIIEVNPFRCCMWPFHDRLDDYVTEQTCQEEINSFSRHGQLVPVLGRALPGDPDHDFELIYGARRLFVARHLNKPLLLECCVLTDRDAILAMEIENRHRKDVSPYERGLSYARWLRSGKFNSQEDLARALSVSASQVSRHLKLARLPSVLANAFPSPLDICEGWGLELMDAWDDAARRPLLARRARALAGANQGLSPDEIYSRLLSASGSGRLVRTQSREEVVEGSHSRPIFRIRQQRRAICLVVPRELVPPAVLVRLRQAVLAILQDASSQIPEGSRKFSQVGSTATESPTIVGGE